MKKQFASHFLEINIAVALISTSGVLGRYITMFPPVTIWFRCLLATFFLFIFIKFKKFDFTILNKKHRNNIILSGILFGGHWVTYFYALQLSNVAIGMLSLFTYPIITVLLEPLFFKLPFNKKHILLGIIILIGVALLAPNYTLENNVTKGILFGVVSAVFYSLRNIILKKNVTHYNGSVLMFYQMTTITLLLWPVLFFYKITPTTGEFAALVTLALVTTTIGHTLFVSSFKNFSISTASIISGVQPIYGIILGILFLNEIPTIKTVVGGLLIVAAVIVENLQFKKA